MTTPPLARARDLSLDLGVALAATLGLLFLPESILPADDSLRGTWLAAPWVIVLLREVGRRVAPRGDAPLRSTNTQRVTTTAAWMVFGLAVLAPARHGLGLPAIDALFAGALFVALGAYVASLLPTLRRRLGRPGVAPAFFLLPFAVYLAILPWAIENRPTDGDEPYYLLLAHSLVEDGDLDLSDEYADGVAKAFLTRELGRQPGDPEGENGEVYSRHNALLPVVLAPAYALAGRTGAAATMSAFAALLAWVVLRLGRRLWPDRPSGAFAAWALLAFAPPLLVYAHQIWVEVPAALLVALALDRLLDLRRRPTARDVLLFGAFLALLVLLKLRLVLLAGPLALLAAVALLRRPRASGDPSGTRALALALVGGLGACLALVLAGNFWRYGNPLKMYSHHELGLLASPPIDWLRGGLGLFYDGAFGLFAHAPAWLLLLPALVVLVRRRDAFLLPLLAVVAPYLFALAPRLEWYGGWSPPFRYPMAVLPLLALALVPLLDRRTAGTRFLVATLGATTAILAILWLVVPGWTYNLADGGSHLSHGVGVLLGVDFARLFPSMVRFRPTTWIVPALSLAVIPIALWRGLPGRRAAARRLAVPAGLVAILVAAAALPALAATWPTRVAHAEDAWVKKSAGEPNPPRWTPQRPLHRGGWLLHGGQALRVPAVAGGEHATLRLVARRHGPGPRSVEVVVGPPGETGTTVTTVRFAPNDSDWRTFEVGPAAWRDGDTLSLRVPPTPHRPWGGVVVDRVDFSWAP